MLGRIYTSQKCSECESVLVHEERRSGCFCPAHPHVRATGNFYVKFGRGIRRRFSSFQAAERFLTGLRFKHDEHTLDPRDYQADKPLAFGKLADEYLKDKSHVRAIRNIRRPMDLAAEAWADRNVKSILPHDFRKFFRDLPTSPKTKHNYRSVLHDFFTRFLVEEGIISRAQVPEIPRVDYELGWRKVTSWEKQDEILEEIRRLSWDLNPKIYFAVDLLRTYTSLRPGDLLRLTEADVGEVLILWRPTKKKNARKVVRLLEEHIETVGGLKEKYPALPHVKFFRHHGKVRGQAYGSAWGKNYLYRWWARACANLGVEGLDLYGGTRHTSVSELAKIEGEHAAREASGHDTNKAFARYCQTQGERALEMARVVRRKGKVVKIKEDES